MSPDAVVVGTNGITSTASGGVDLPLYLKASSTTATPGHISIGAPVDITAGPLTCRTFSADQTVFWTTMAPITWDTTVIDLMSMASAQYINIPMAGLYEVRLHLEVQPDTSTSSASGIIATITNHTITTDTIVATYKHYIAPTAYADTPTCIDITAWVNITTANTNSFFCSMGNIDFGSQVHLKTIFKQSQFSVRKIA